MILATLAHAEIKPGDVEGSWDFHKPERKFALSAVLREKGNRLPSFWAGEPVGDTFGITTEHDLLGDEWIAKPTGQLRLRLTAAAAKTGMEQQLPGGTWTTNLKAQPVSITLDTFGAFKPMPEDPKKKNGGPVLSGPASGTLVAEGKTLPIQGTLVLHYVSGQAKFNLEGSFALGQALTLELHMPGVMGTLEPRL